MLVFVMRTQSVGVKGRGEEWSGAKEVFCSKDC